MNSQLFQIFSTREISTFVWLFVIFIILVCNKTIRQSLIGVMKASGSGFIVFGVLFFIANTLLIIDILGKVSYWDITMIKDTAFWFLFTGLAIFFSLYKANEVSYFSNLLKNNIKAIIIFEFIVNFYTFNFLVELLILPLITIVSIMEMFSKKDPNLKNINLLFNKLLSIIGFSLILFVVYKTVSDYENFFSILSLKILLLPIILTVFSMPYFYCLTLYMRYDSFIKMVKHTHRNENPKVIKNLILATFKYANININKLGRIWKYQINFDAAMNNPFDYIKRVSKITRYHIGNTAKLKMFNDIQKVIKNLSKNGIGKLEDWHKSYGGDECYYSMTNYYQFGSKDFTKMLNSLTYYLTGEELYIKQLELVLDVGYKQDKSEAIEKFIDIIKLTFESLLIPVPNDLLSSIISNKKYQKEFNSYEIEVTYENFERIETFKLYVTTK